ncbi:hypothetical protein TRIP_C21522 [Candidatus Zixiibacteriota bacterium]|nr:hypothetical protein TRIP_C21522 [candidate division Zixibacteria bacterium]
MGEKCNNIRFQDMLHAYELHMLSGNDLEAFEQHLLECEYCAREVERLKEVSDLLEHDSQVALNLEQIASRGRETSSATIDAESPYGQKRYRFIAAAVLAAAIIIFLVLKPWDIKIVPEKSAYAENRLTIMFFENVPDPSDTSKLGEIATNLLINDLSGSGFLQVLSSQRLYDIMRLLAFDGASRFDKNITTLVAEKAKAKWILNGAILKSEPNIVIASQLSDVSSGAVIASQKITGRPGEDIFALIDTLAQAIEKDLSLPSELSLPTKVRISQMGGQSREAWRYYLQGVDNYNKLYLHDAVGDFKKALEYDSTLAMVYYYLALINDPAHIKKAEEYSSKVGIKEKYYIDILSANISNDTKVADRLLRELVGKFPEEKMAYFWLSRIEQRRDHILQSADFLNKTIALDSLYKMAYVNLIYSYISLDSFSAALHAADRYAAIAPDEVNPLDCRGDIYSAFGKNEEAIKEFRAVLKIKPDFNEYKTLKKLTILRLCSGDYSALDSSNKVIDSFDAKQKYWLLPYLKMYQGKLYQAINYFDSAAALNDSVVVYRLNKARIYEDLDKPQRSLEDLEWVLKLINEEYPNEQLAYRNLFIYYLAKADLFDSALSQAEQLGQWCEAREYSDRYYWGALGSIELARENYARAAGYFDKASSPDRDLTIYYLAGLAYLFDNQYAKSAALLERVTRECPLIYSSGTWPVKANYYLGRAYEAMGKKSEAAYRFQYFTDLWKDADPQIECLLDARARLLKLK